MAHIIQVLIDYGIIGISIAAFCEAIIMPIPMEIVYLPVVLLNPKKALVYTFVLIGMSTLGTIVGYSLGEILGIKILSKFIESKNIKKIKNLYIKNVFMTIITSAFTPIPYEAYVLSAGIFRVKFKRFILGAVLSRTIRYLPQGILIYFYGVKFNNNLKIFTTAIGIITIIFILKCKSYLKCHDEKIKF